MQRGIEAQACGEGALAAAPGGRAAEEVGLGALAEARLGELFDGLGGERLVGFEREEEGAGWAAVTPGAPWWLRCGIPGGGGTVWYGAVWHEIYVLGSLFWALSPPRYSMDRWEVDPHIFLAVLVDGEVDGAERTSPNLLLDEVLIDAVLRGAVVL